MSSSLPPSKRSRHSPGRGSTDRGSKSYSNQLTIASLLLRQAKNPGETKTNFSGYVKQNDQSNVPVIVVENAAKQAVLRCQNKLEKAVMNVWRGNDQGIPARGQSYFQIQLSVWMDSGNLRERTEGGESSNNATNTKVEDDQDMIEAYQDEREGIPLLNKASEVWRR